ncbi:unnamed protein product, partial [Timema podura]|nr:unnamed protein product [Timema podura]
TSKLQSKQSFLELRGPAGSIFIVSVLSDNTPGVKNDLNSIVRKSNIKRVLKNEVANLPQSALSLPKILDHVIKSLKVLVVGTSMNGYRLVWVGTCMDGYRLA